MTSNEAAWNKALLTDSTYASGLTGDWMLSVRYMPQSNRCSECLAALCGIYRIGLDRIKKDGSLYADHGEVLRGRGTDQGR
jgi:hypothetical protein